MKSYNTAIILSLVSLGSCVEISVKRTMTGAQISAKAPAIQALLSSQHKMPHSAGTQNSGPLYTVMYTTVVMVR